MSVYDYRHQGYVLVMLVVCLIRLLGKLWTNLFNGWALGKEMMKF